MKIILFGAPGVGKGTQASFIAAKYGIPHISVGNLLRKEIIKKSKLGINVKHAVENGSLIDDNIITSLVKLKIHKKSSYLLDGFPRTVIQAQSLRELNENIDCIIVLTAPKKVIIERALGRLIHKKSGRIYHIKFNPPKNKNYDNLTGEKLVSRTDDKKYIISSRIDDYYNNIKNILQYYDKKTCFILNANLSINEIHKKITNIINNFIYRT